MKLSVEPIDEVGQLLSDIQEEENSTLPEINEEPALELSEEKLDATPTQEYDSVLLDQSLEEESSEEVVEPVADETAENEKLKQLLLCKILKVHYLNLVLTTKYSSELRR